MSTWGRLRGVGWIVLKDMQILRRSPLMLAMLVIYPVVVALLIGFSLSRGPEKPKVAVYIEIAKGDSEFVLGGQKIDTLKFTDDLAESIEPEYVNSRKAVIDKVRSGKALGGIVVPRDLPQRLQTQLEQPTIEVYVNEEDPLKRQLVDNTINAQIARANLALSKTFARIGIGYSDLLIKGGKVNFLGQEFNVLGVGPSEKIMKRVQKSLPPGSESRRELQKVIDFSNFAVKNFDLADDALAVIGEPIKADKHVVSGKSPSLTSFRCRVRSRTSDSSRPISSAIFLNGSGSSGKFPCSWLSNSLSVSSNFTLFFTATATVPLPSHSR